MDGTELIAAERARQINAEGWTPEQYDAATEAAEKKYGHLVREGLFQVIGELEMKLAVPESQDGLPALDAEYHRLVDWIAPLDMPDNTAAELRCRERQIIATRAELRNLKLAASLACELHGCASKTCTMAQYHEDVQKLFADLAAKDAELRAAQKSKQVINDALIAKCEEVRDLYAQIANLTKEA